MTALHIIIQEPNIFQIDNLCCEDATEAEKCFADKLEEIIAEALKDIAVNTWQIKRGG